MRAVKKWIPFRDVFILPIQDRSKTTTARTNRYGKRGDIIESPAGSLRLLRVLRMPLADVRDLYWKAEGFASAEEFVKGWILLHRRAGFRPTQMVWLHEFEWLRPNTWIDPMGPR